MEDNRPQSAASPRIDHVVTSQHSRDVARCRPDQMMDRYQKERTKLIAEKQALESKLSDLEANKRQRALQITQRRLPRVSAIEATQRLEVEFAESRKGIHRDLAAINERLQAMKKFMLDKGAFNEERQCDVLRRVEAVLLRIESLLVAATRRGE